MSITQSREFYLGYPPSSGTFEISTSGCDFDCPHDRARLASHLSILTSSTSPQYLSFHHTLGSPLQDCQLNVSWRCRCLYDWQTLIGKAEVACMPLSSVWPIHTQSWTFCDTTPTPSCRHRQCPHVRRPLLLSLSQSRSRFPAAAMTASMTALTPDTDNRDGAEPKIRVVTVRGSSLRSW